MNGLLAGHSPVLFSSRLLWPFVWVFLVQGVFSYVVSGYDDTATRYYIDVRGWAMITAVAISPSTLLLGLSWIARWRHGAAA